MESFLIKSSQKINLLTPCDRIHEILNTDGKCDFLEVRPWHNMPTYRYDPDPQKEAKIKLLYPEVFICIMVIKSSFK